MLVKENSLRETYVFIVPYEVNSKNDCKPFGKGIYVFYLASLNSCVSEAV